MKYSKEQHTIWVREWRKKHPGRTAELSRKHTQYVRENYVWVPGGKHIKGPKRPQPAVCELCEKPAERMNYHCWDAENTLHGLWCCGICLKSLHSPTTKESEKFELDYILLKEEITRSY